MVFRRGDDWIVDEEFGMFYADGGGIIDALSEIYDGTMEMVLFPFLESRFGVPGGQV